MIPPPFDKLQKAFSVGQQRFSKTMTVVFAIPAGAEYEGEWENLGVLNLPCGEDSRRWACRLALPKEFLELEWSGYFIKHSIQAGQSLPLTVKDSLVWFNPTTPFAWWFASWWRFGSPGRKSLPLGVGTTFSQPFENSVRAIERFDELGVFDAQGQAQRRIPLWDKESSKLFFADQEVRKISRQGQNIIRILDAFQELKWPVRIDDPLPGGKDSERLNDAVKTLNSGLSLMTFHADGSAAGISWSAKEI